MRQKFWITLVACLAYCIDRELYRAIDYLKEQVRVLLEQQQKDNRILLNNTQRRRLAVKARKLTRKMLEEPRLPPSPIIKPVLKITTPNPIIGFPISAYSQIIYRQLL